VQAASQKVQRRRAVPGGFPRCNRSAENARTGDASRYTDRAQLVRRHRRAPFTLETEGFGPDGPTVRVHDATGHLTLEFSALTARFSTVAELVVATVPQAGLTNIFTIDLHTGRASYVATTPVSARGFTLAAWTHIAWSPTSAWIPARLGIRACDRPVHGARRSRVLIRRRPTAGWRAIHRLERLIDPDTMQYRSSRPQVGRAGRGNTE